MKTTDPTTRTPKAATLLCAGVLIAAGAAMPGCRGDREDKPPRQFLPDMDDSPKMKPQTGTEFFADGRSMRPVVEGTVAYGRWDFDIRNTSDAWAAPFKQERADLLKEDDAVYRGIGGTRPDGKPEYVQSIPIAVTPELLKRGQERFGIYCAVCHGYNGTGDGMVGQRWAGLTVANLHDPKYGDPNEPDQKSADGFLFHTAMWGVPNPASPVPNMPGYAHALSERDAWAIVAYIRALRETTSLNEVPEARRSVLEQERAKLPPPAPPAEAEGSGGNP